MIPYWVYDKITIGPVTIYTWGLMIGLAFIVGLFVALKEAKRKQIDSDKIINLAILVLIGSFLGARLVYIFQYLDYYLANPLDIFKVWQGGVVFYGGLGGAFLFGWLYIKKCKLSFWQIADIIAPAVAIGIFIGRIGCCLINDHIGTVVSLPWSIRYIDGTLRHPVAEYLSLNGLILFLFLWAIRKKIKQVGMLFLIFLLWYGATRFFLDFTRCYDLPLCDLRWWGMTFSQWGSMGILIIVGIIIKLKCKTPKTRHLT